MSDFKRCPICGKFDFFGRHKCPPSWTVWNPADGDEAEEWACRTVYADDAGEAAEKFCEDDDCESAEYQIIGRGYCDRISVKSKDGTVQHFKITAEAVPTYHATEIDV